MRRLKKYALLIIPTLLLITAAVYLEWLFAMRPPPDRQLADGTRLEWDSCWFEVNWPRVAHCGWLQPPQNGDARGHVLPLVVLRYRGWHRSEGPVLFLNGGPGAATGLEARDIKLWFDWREDNPWPHDLVIYDQRGVGLSRPRLECPGLTKFYRESLRLELSAREEQRRAYELARECLTDLRAAGERLDEYSTRHSARDVLRLMRAFGAERWNLYGVSYGTRLALEVLREDASAIRGVILDSVYPPERHGLLEYPRTLGQSFERLFLACEADSGCLRKFASPRANFARALRGLRERALEMEVTHWSTGEPVRVKLNDARLVSAVFMGLYQWDLIAYLPAAIDAAARGEVNHALRELMENYANFMVDDGFHDAVYHAVECNDMRAVSYAEYQSALQSFPWLREYLAPAWEFDTCRDWRAPEAQALSAQAIRASVPVLLLSGEFDPVTPPEWAALTATSLEHAFHVVFKGIGHDAIDSDECASEVAGDFLAHPMRAPRASCLSAQAAIEFQDADRR